MQDFQLTAERMRWLTNERHSRNFQNQLVRIVPYIGLQFLADRIRELGRINVGAGKETTLGDIGGNLQLW